MISDVTHPALDERHAEHERDQADESDVEPRTRADLVRPSGEREPVADDPAERAPCLERLGTRVEEAVGAAASRRGDDRVHDDTEDGDAAEDRRQPTPGPDRRDEDEQDHAVEEPATVPGQVADRRLRTETLEHEHRDEEGAEHGACEAARAAEDHHRVDDDEDRGVVVVRERRPGGAPR